MLFTVVASDGAINGVATRSQRDVPITEPQAGNAISYLKIEIPTAEDASAIHHTIVPELLFTLGMRPFANFNKQDVSAKPSNWFRDGELPRLVRGAQLKEANLQYLIAEEAFLVNANLHGAKLKEVDLRATNLFAATLTQTQLNEACVDKTTKLPEGLVHTKPCTFSALKKIFTITIQSAGSTKNETD